ncbi:MAG: serine protein kinase, partial [Phycisphaerae bacterium]|nr:serine protein kinase [Phycisphaerae bacterium]
MAEVQRKFTEIIEKDRAEQASTDWRGTFIEYLEKVKQDPSIAKLAHARLYSVLMDKGVSDTAEAGDPKAARFFGDEPVKVYNFFKTEFFGIEPTIAQI